LRKMRRLQKLKSFNSKPLLLHLCRMSSNPISLRRISEIAVPMIVSGIAVNIVGVMDILFVAPLGEAQVGGTGNGQILYALLFIIGMGFTTGVQIIIGRRNGEKEHSKVGELFNQAGLFAIGFGLIMLILTSFALEPALHLLFKSKGVILYTTEYMMTRIWGLPFVMINLLFTAFYVGITKTKILGWVTSAVALLNVGLDYSLIYGYWGMPELGVQGAALASVIAEAIGSSVFLLYTISKVDRKLYGLWIFKKIEWDLIRQALKVAGPIMIQNVLTVGAWFAFFVMIENLGERELAISQVIRGIYIFLMVPIFSLADGTNTLTSNLIGASKAEFILPLARKTTLMGLLGTLIFMLLLLSFPETAVGLFTKDQNFIRDTLPTLYLTSVSLQLATVSMIAFRAVSGTGNTRMALKIEIIGLLLYLIFVWWVTRNPENPLHWAWASEFVYFGSMAVLSWFYLLKGNWKEIKV
jgi:putative MATE family efflux protein